MIKNCFQILVRDSKEALPSLIKESSDIFKSSLPGHTYTLYEKEMIEDFIYQNFDKETLNAFHTLKPYSYKADLAKYCISFINGGWYSDITIRMSAIINYSGSTYDFIGFVDKGNGMGRANQLPYPIVASLFYVNKGSKIMKKAIETILLNCRTKYYGITPICPTGPGVLGRSLAHVGCQSNHLIGTFMPLTPNHDNLNRSYVLPDGTILAKHKDSWFSKAKTADISIFGLKGTNNYLDMYFNKDIYH